MGTSLTTGRAFWRWQRAQSKHWWVESHLFQTTEFCGAGLKYLRHAEIQLVKLLRVGSFLCDCSSLVALDQPYLTRHCAIVCVEGWGLGCRQAKHGYLAGGLSALLYDLLGDSKPFQRFTLAVPPDTLSYNFAWNKWNKCLQRRLLALMRPPLMTKLVWSPVTKPKPTNKPQKHAIRFRNT